MTIQELKEKKQALEKEIAEKICAFEEECGFGVTDISISRRYMNFEEYIYLVEPIKIDIEIKL